MFVFKAEFEETYCGARDLSSCRQLYLGLLTFDAWLAKSTAGRSRSAETPSGLGVEGPTLAFLGDFAQEGEAEQAEQP